MVNVRRALAMGGKSAIDVCVLGPMRVQLNAEPVQLSNRLLGLLAMLTMNANHVVSRTALFEALWPELDETRAASNLGYTVNALRTRLGESASSGEDGWIHTESPGYVLEASSETLDVLRFEHLLSLARAIESHSRVEAQTAYEAAISVWDDSTGTAYRNLEHAEFCQLEIHRLRELWVSAVEEQIAIKLDLGEGENVVPRLAALTSMFPYRERLWGHRMTALYRSGRQSEAFGVFAQVRELLGETLGIEPSPELQALEEKMLLQSPELDRQPDDQRRTTPVPRSLRPLIGRETDVATLSRWLGDRPLVTLTGLGGVGKTRLAQEVARVTSPSFGAQPVFVDLAAVTEPASVGGALAAACGLRQHPGRPSMDLVVEFLRIQHRVVLLDNCEHLLPDLLEQVRRILDDVDHVSILATSRIPLGLYGELVHRVRPLPLDQGGSEAPAVRLLMEAADSTDAMIDAKQSAVDLATLLGGIPLAIELAARQLSATTVDQLLRELVSTPERGTRLGALDASATVIRDACDWSYRMLDETEQELFRLLAVTTGGAGTELLTHIVSVAGATDQQLADRIGRLAHVGLVERRVSETSLGDHVRWTMLEPVRQFAESTFEGEGLAQARSSLAQAASRLASTFARAMMLDPRVGALISDEEPNFIAAIQRSLAAGRPEVAASIVSSLDYYWVFAGRVREGRRWAERTCDAYPGLDDSTPHLPDAPLRASLLRARGFLASIDGDYANGIAHLERSIALLDGLTEALASSTDERHRAAAVRSAAWSRMHLARTLSASYFSRYGFDSNSEEHHLIERAAGLYERAATDLQKADFDRDRAFVLPFLGWNAVIGGIEEPEHFFETAISLAEAENLEIPRGIGQVTLAWFLLIEGSESERVHELLDLAAATFRRLKDVYSLQISLTVSTVAALARNDRDHAVKSLVEALDLMTLQGGQEWGHLTLGLAAVVLAEIHSQALEGVVAWLDTRTPGWRRALKSSGVRPIDSVPAESSREDMKFATESQIARFARAALLHPSASEGPSGRPSTQWSTHER